VAEHEGYPGNRHYDRFQWPWRSGNVTLGLASDRVDQFFRYRIVVPSGLKNLAGFDDAKNALKKREKVDP
jgi:hypothetical protein